MKSPPAGINKAPKPALIELTIRSWAIVCVKVSNNICAAFAPVLKALYKEFPTVSDKLTINCSFFRRSSSSLDVSLIASANSALLLSPYCAPAS
jgi:hypothetical protein